MAVARDSSKLRVMSRRSRLPVSASHSKRTSPSLSCGPSGSGRVRNTGSHHRRRSTVSDINECRPKKGDKDYIKWPENGFILFCRKCCEDCNLAQGTGDAGNSDGSAPTKKLHQTDLSNMIRQQWKYLSSE